MKKRTAPNLLMDTHFPGSLGHMAKPRVARTLTEIEVPEVEFISPTRVRKAIWSFGDLKAAGPDELKPIVLKHLGEKAVNKLVEFLGPAVYWDMFRCDGENPKQCSFQHQGRATTHRSALSDRSLSPPSS